MAFSAANGFAQHPHTYSNINCIKCSGSSLPCPDACDLAGLVNQLCDGAVMGGPLDVSEKRMCPDAFALGVCEVDLVAWAGAARGVGVASGIRADHKRRCICYTGAITCLAA
jgi:hypothetical protein